MYKAVFNIAFQYEFVHTELVQVFYNIKWISSGAFEFEKKTTNNP
jgi:hypothetical protein